MICWWWSDWSSQHPLISDPIISISNSKPFDDLNKRIIVNRKHSVYFFYFNCIQLDQLDVGDSLDLSVDRKQEEATFLYPIIYLNIMNNYLFNYTLFHSFNSVISFRLPACNGGRSFVRSVANQKNHLLQYDADR